MTEMCPENNQPFCDLEISGIPTNSEAFNLIKSACSHLESLSVYKIEATTREVCIARKLCYYSATVELKGIWKQLIARVEAIGGSEENALDNALIKILNNHTFENKCSDSVSGIATGSDACNTLQQLVEQTPELERVGVTTSSLEQADTTLHFAKMTLVSDSGGTETIVFQGSSKISAIEQAILHLEQKY